MRGRPAKGDLPRRSAPAERLEAPPGGAAGGRLAGRVRRGGRGADGDRHCRPAQTRWLGSTCQARLRHEKRGSETRPSCAPGLGRYPPPAAGIDPAHWAFKHRRALPPRTPRSPLPSRRSSCIVSRAGTFPADLGRCWLLVRRSREGTSCGRRAEGRAGVTTGGVSSTASGWKLHTGKPLFSGFEGTVAVRQGPAAARTRERSEALEGARARPGAGALSRTRLGLHLRGGGTPPAASPSPSPRPSSPAFCLSSASKSQCLGLGRGCRRAWRYRSCGQVGEMSMGEACG